jgi:DNA modification methylase
MKDTIKVKVEHKVKPTPKGTTVLEEQANGEFSSTIEPADLRLKYTQAAALWVPTAALAVWTDNPRDNDKAVPDVVSSMKRFGFGSPIVARPNGEIIAGHTRLKAALELRMPEVPVRFLDLDPAEAHLMALADNRVGEIADWNDDLLADVLLEMETKGADLTGIGWSDDELADIMAKSDPLPMDGSEDDVPEVQAEVHSKPGEVYELGPHRLICGDCRAQKDVSTLLDGVVVNVAFTSPPYASQRKYDESSGFKPIKPDAYVEWFDAVQANVREYLAEDGSWFVNIKEHCEDGQRSLYVKDLTLAHVRRWGWRFNDELCWIHGGIPGEVHTKFKNQFEPIFHFCLQKDLKIRPMAVAKISNNVPQGGGGNMAKQQGTGLAGADFDSGPGLAFPGNVLSVGKNREALGHSAAYPIELPVFFIKAFSDPTDAVFDPFLGSGTTLIAAAQERRVAYGMEISPGYCDVIRRRWTRWAHTHNQDPGTGALEDA